MYKATYLYRLINDKSELARDAYGSILGFRTELDAINSAQDQINAGRYASLYVVKMVKAIKRTAIVIEDVEQG